MNEHFTQNSAPLGRSMFFPSPLALTPLPMKGVGAPYSARLRLSRRPEYKQPFEGYKTVLDHPEGSLAQRVRPPAARHEEGHPRRRSTGELACLAAAAALLLGCSTPKTTELSKTQLQQIDELNRVLASARATQAQAAARIREAELAQQRTREDFLAGNPALSQADRKLVAAGRYRVGFSAAAVRAARGEPERIRQSTDATDTTEVWVYRGGHETITLVRGLVTSFQTTR